MTPPSAPTPGVGTKRFFRIGRGCYDPLYAHCRVCYGPTWARGIYNVNVGRYSGTAPLPPRTLVQQTTLVSKSVNVTNVRNVTVLSPLGQAHTAP